MNKIRTTILIVILLLSVFLAFLPLTLQAQSAIDGAGIDPRGLFYPRIFDWVGLINIWPLTPDQAKGDLNCRRSGSDCNRCTADVVGQFRKIASGHKQRKAKPWRFQWGRTL